MATSARELDRKVVEETIRWFEEDEDHYTPESYLVGESEDSETEDDVAGRHIIQSCAIGGVEQALWRATGYAINGEDRNRFANTGNRPRVTKDDPLSVYRRVMFDLNRKAREMFAASGEHIMTIEDITFRPPNEESDGREEMLEVLHAVAKQLA